MRRTASILFFGLAVGLLLPGCGQQASVRKKSKKEEARRIQADDLSPRQKTLMGRALSARLLRKYGLYQDQTVRNYVNRVGRLLASHQQKHSNPDASFHFGVLTKYHKNLYVAPGHYVWLTRGLLDACRNEAELAGLLAHGLIHHHQNHLLERMDLRGLIPGTLSASKAGAQDNILKRLEEDSPQMKSFLSDWARQGVSFHEEPGYSVRQERQANRGAVRLLTRAGYDPESLLHILRRIVRHDSKDMLGTHPITEQRLESLEQYIDRRKRSSSGVQLKERFEKNTS